MSTLECGTSIFTIYPCHFPLILYINEWLLTMFSIYVDKREQNVDKFNYLAIFVNVKIESHKYVKVKKS